MTDIEQFLKSCIDLDPQDLESEFVKYPGNLAFWNSKHTDSVRSYLFAKMHREEVEAALQLDIRASAETLGKKVTEKIIESMVLVSKGYKEARVAEIEAEAEDESEAGE